MLYVIEVTRSRSWVFFLEFLRAETARVFALLAKFRRVTAVPRGRQVFSLGMPGPDLRSRMWALAAVQKVVRGAPPWSSEGHRW